MQIDSGWKYKDVLKHIEALKEQYKEVLASFSWKEHKEKNAVIYNLKRQIYSLKIEEWRKNKIWEYLNSDEIKANLDKYI